jgi:3-hydroxybutyryl-CoA dehydratase
MSSGDHSTRFSIGQEFFESIPISEQLMETFSQISGDKNPLHVDNEYAKKNGFKGRVAFGNILGLLVSKLVGMSLGDENVMLISQKINYHQPIYIGNTIKITGEITSISNSVNVIELKLVFSDEDDTIVASGKCQVRCH